MSVRKIKYLINSFNSTYSSSVYEVYNETAILTHRQIEAYGYILDENLLANATLNPDNEGFCTPGKENCLPTGIINVTLCNQSKF